MNIDKRFCGIFSPVVSPCDEQDKFSEVEFAANIDRLFRAGVQGLYVCGATGDAFSLQPSERKQAVEIAVGLARRWNRRVIVHVGGAAWRDALALAEHAAACGADAVSSIPPVYYDQEQLVGYYTAIAKDSGLPVFVYHVPVLTHHESTVEEMIRILDVPGVAGLKLTDWNLFFMRQLQAQRPGIMVFNGYDELLCLGLMYGATGSIGTWVNLFPELYLAVYDAVKAGQLEKGLALQKAFVDFLAFGWRFGIGAVFEWIMHEKGYATRCFRKPSCFLDNSTAAEVAPVLLGWMDKLNELRAKLA